MRNLIWEKVLLPAWATHQTDTAMTSHQAKNLSTKEPREILSEGVIFTYYQSSPYSTHWPSSIVSISAMLDYKVLRKTCT